MRLSLTAAVTILMAQTVLMTQASAVSCVPSNAAMSAADIGAFLNSPASLLDGSPEGGGKLASIVRKLATSDSSSVPVIGKVIAIANSDQGQSIGAGLGQAATMCRQKNPEVVAEIQEAILVSEKRDVLASYQAVVQDTITTAVGDRDPSLPDPSTLLTEANPGGGIFRALPTPTASVADPSPSFSTGQSAATISSSRSTPSTTLTTLSVTSPALLSTSPSR